MNHRGAGSIKELLAADFKLWMTLHSKIQELKQKLENNIVSYKGIIEILRDYYKNENNNPGGVIFANSMCSYSGTEQNLLCVSHIKGYQPLGE